MKAVERHVADGLARLQISRGKVNALTPEVIETLRTFLEEAAQDEETRAVILTGSGQFFSFGFDIPEFLAFTPARFTAFLETFTSFYRVLFAFPKPVVAAINGHAVAGGCMLALACDYRLMTSDRGKIGLNEVSFASTVFAGSAEMLRFWVGSAAASAILLGGQLYRANEALQLGLIHEAVPAADFESRVRERAEALATAKQPAYGHTKMLLRAPIVDEMLRSEAKSIERFVAIWYSRETWRELEKITIR